VALLVSGSLADLIDIRIWFFIAGAGAILIHLAGAAVPAIMTIEDRPAESGQNAGLSANGESAG